MATQMQAQQSLSAKLDEMKEMVTRRLGEEPLSDTCQVEREKEEGAPRWLLTAPTAKPLTRGRVGAWARREWAGGEAGGRPR